MTIQISKAMFTVKQILSAHSLVKSGADFPRYVQDLIKLGVSSYETFVSDGHTIYYGANGYRIESQPKYAPQVIADQCNNERFQRELKEHQQGKTDYLTFIKLAATMGVEKWVVVMGEMSCTYFDKGGSVVLVEGIPGA